MLNAAGKKLFWVFAISILIFIISPASVRQLVLDFILVGRIPGTEVKISFDAMALGSIFAIWAIATYNLTISGLLKLQNLVSEKFDLVKYFEEISL